MKKRLFSILLALCMVLCLVPTTVFAESETEEPPVCSCETACTAEAMNADCPICGAEGALPENCECSELTENAEPEGEENEEQPEGKVSDPQPETALTALSGEGETPAASGAVTDVSTAADLIAAIANSAVGTVKLAGDISISTSLTVKRTVTLDLNGHVLKYESANEGSVIVVEGGGNLTLTDSNDEKVHRFNKSVMPWALAADDATGENFVDVSGGVITGGTGTDLSTYGGTTWYCGGGALIKNGGSLTMRGGNIIGCSAECGGGVCIDSERNGEPGQFSMSGGSIIGCVASNSGGGVFASGKFQMSDKAVIRSCTVESTIQLICGGGVYVNGSSSFEMSGEAKIEGCQAISTSAYGGGVYVSSSSSFVMTAKAEIEGCRAISNSANSSKGGGVHLANATTFTLSGSAVIQNCTATNSVNSGKAYGGGVSAACVWEITLEDNASIAGCIAANGSGLYITGSQLPGYGKLFANGGSVDGDVVLGDPTDTTVGPGTITGTGETKFNGKVTVTTGSTIESGKFNGEVINNGTITGGTFTGTVINNGTITDGTFSGKPARITGSGTETDPYQISTAEGLKWFRDKVNSAKTKEETKICAVLTEDIDLNNEPWTPIGIGEDTRKEDLPYSGTFDGNGHTISGLNVNYGDKNGGLFCYVKSATIKNLTVAGSVTYSSGDGIAYGGIVGYADSSTIENCTNRCTVTGRWYAGGIVGWSADSDIIGCANFGNISSPFRSGGICGIVIGQVDAYGIDATIRDCYNVGMVSGKYAGGITGHSDSSDIDILIANCYNVGSLHGSTNTGEIIGDLSGPTCTTIDNCYYLPTGNPASTSDRVNVKRTDSKTAAEFADGTVRKLLKDGERGNNADPWAGECKYLDAAGKTLPVFNGQGDAHDHQSNDWEHNDTEHWQVCTCGAVFHKAEHSGGTATCTQRATCTVCGAEYGNVLGHDFTTSWTHDDNEHWKQCSRCDKKDDVSPHTWDNGTITTAPTCTKAGEETYSCTKCDATKIEPIPATGHSWKSDWTSDATHHWHECANKNCDVKDNAGKYGYAEHSGGKATCTQNAVCKICKAEYGEKLPHDFTAETMDAKYLKSAATCTEKAVYYKSCAVCGLSSEGTADEATFFSGNVLDHDWGAWTQNSDEKTHTRICKRDTSHTETENCIDANKDHKCDICDYIISECADDNKDHKCDYCGKKLTEHTGGKVTCKDKAKCEVCGAEYGELDAKNHTDLKHFPATAATKTTEGNIEYWYCEGCGKYYSDKDGTKEIKKADTVTAKLKDDSKSPQTGDTSNLALWIALLFVSGGAAIGTTVVSRKKKYNK